MSNLNYNRVILGGRMTGDPELKKTASGTSATTFTVAVNRRKPKDSNEDPVADFINCVAWKERAELITKYFRKGSAILIDGQIQTRTWTDQNDQKRYATEVLVDNVHFVDSKADAQQGTPEAAQNPPVDVPQAYGGNGGAQFNEMANDDDLPFDR